MRARRFLAFGLVALLVGCVPPAPAPEAPPPQPRPVPQPEPAPPPPALEWQDAPLSPGGWSYHSDPAGYRADFGPAGAPSFSVRCDRGSRQVLLERSGAGAAAAITIRTSFGARAFNAAVQENALRASVPANDRFLDSMAFSRGRFSVEVAGSPPLIVPSWAEPARVIEDCRG